MEMISLYIVYNTEKSMREKRIQLALRAHYGTDSVELPRLYKTEKGQPYLSDGTFVSITDSGNCWILAVSEYPVGIDLQKHTVGKKQVTEAELQKKCGRLAQRFFHPSETSFVLEAPEEGKQREARFFSVWTAKEAYVKYTGQGIDGTFSTFNVREMEDVVFSYPEIAEAYTCCICTGQPAAWMIKELNL